MIVGLGMDLVEIGRIRELRRRRGERFLRRVYTAGEIRDCLERANPDPSLAARFAAKEAGMKALGTGWGQGVGWQDLEVARAPQGPPGLILRGGAAVRAGARGVGAVHLSLSHDGGVAAAVVVLEKTA